MSNINTNLSFKFIDENKCEVTEDSINGSGIVRKYLVPSKEVFDGILKFSIENKKIEPVSIPALNYFQSPAKPTLLGYDYFPQNQYILATIYVPSYEHIYKYDCEISAYYPNGTPATEELKNCIDSTSSLFKAMTGEGLIQSHIEYIDSRHGEKKGIINVPWKQPAQLFVFLYSMNMATANPFENCNYLSHVCWYVDGDLSNGYNDVALYQASMPNHYQKILVNSDIYCNAICFGSGEVSHDIRNVFGSVAKLPYTINNHDLFSDSTAIKMLAWFSKGSIFKQELLKAWMKSKESHKKESFKLLATGDAFNHFYLKQVSGKIDLPELDNTHIVSAVTNIKARLATALAKASKPTSFTAYSEAINSNLNYITEISSGMGTSMSQATSYEMNTTLNKIRDYVSRAKLGSIHSLFK